MSDDVRTFELLERLQAAERVCVLVGVNATDRQTERGKALLQSWMDWQHQYGPSAGTVTDEEIAEYARRRDVITERTLASIRQDYPTMAVKLNRAAGESTPEVTE